jgi:hypothetical protein
MRVLSARWRGGFVTLRECRAAVMSMLAVMRWASAGRTTQSILNRLVLKGV